MSNILHFTPNACEKIAPQLGPGDARPGDCLQALRAIVTHDLTQASRTLDDSLTRLRSCGEMQIDPELRAKILQGSLEIESLIDNAYEQLTKLQRDVGS